MRKQYYWNGQTRLITFGGPTDCLEWADLMLAEIIEQENQLRRSGAWSSALEEFSKAFFDPIYVSQATWRLSSNDGRLTILLGFDQEVVRRRMRSPVYTS